MIVKTLISSFRRSFRELRVFWLLLGVALLAEAGFRLHNFGIDGVIYPQKFRPGTLMNAGLIIPDERVGKRLKPNTDTYFKGARITVNRWGFRGPDIELDKKPGTLRIAVIGASITMGSGVADRETFSFQLQEILSTEHEKPVEVINMGIGSYTPYQIMRHYTLYGHQFNPDLILVPALPGRIDKKYSRKTTFAWGGDGTYPVYRVLLESSMLAVYLRELYRDHAALLARRDDWRKRPKQALKERRVSRGYSKIDLLTNLSLSLERDKTPVVMVMMKTINLSPMYKPYPYDHSYRREARLLEDKLTNLYLIDIYDSFGREYVSSDRIYPGDEHPNAQSHRRYAELIAAELIPLLKDLDLD